MVINRLSVVYSAYVIKKVFKAVLRGGFLFDYPGNVIRGNVLFFAVLTFVSFSLVNYYFSDKNMPTIKTFRTCLTGLLFLCSVQVFADTAKIYFNGDILTMEGDKPQYVEAIIVKDKRIAFTGSLRDALSQAGANPTMHDLKGQTLLPSFIDAWGHFTLIAQNTLSVNLGYFSKKPPHTTQELISRLKAEARPLNGWIVGSEYADAFLADGPAFTAALNDYVISNNRQWDDIFPDGDMFKLGFMGQGLYVSPDKDLVIAYFSTSPDTTPGQRYMRPIAKSGLFK